MKTKRTVEELLEEQNKYMKDFCETMQESFSIMSRLLLQSQGLLNHEAKGGLDIRAESRQIEEITLKQEDDFGIWKQEVFTLASEAAKRNNTTCKELLLTVQKEITKKYGICWHQELIDYRQQYGEEAKADLYELAYNNEQAKSILRAMLLDLSTKDSLQEVKRIDLNKIVEPLARKRKDNSNCYCATYRLIYKEMERRGVSWKYNLTRYQNRHDGKLPKNKTAIIYESTMLQRKLKESVQHLLLK